jgi:anaerobic dimethyl sulfoxide reductase subunit A
LSRDVRHAGDLCPLDGGIHIGEGQVLPFPGHAGGNIETWESLNDPLAEKFPLQLISPHFKRRAHSQFDNLPWLRELQVQAIGINAIDAKARGIQDEELVRVFNDRGEVRIPAKVTERIMPGVVSLPQGAWYAPDENGIDHGGCANVLTNNVTSPGGAFASHTALVQIEKVVK